MAAADFRTLIANDTLLARIRELAVALESRYPDTPPCVVAVMEGARIFARHLCARLAYAVPIHAVRASSYGSGTISSGTVDVAEETPIPVRGQRVLLIEDIVDTGRTVARLREHFLAAGAMDVTVITLLSKPERRVVDVTLDYVGFEIPNEFVIGFGMDVAGRYRELDRVAVYEEARAVGNG